MNATEIVTIVANLSTILVFVLIHVFHNRPLAQKVESISQTLQKDAPQLAQVATGVATVAQDL